ncbi:MAG TPA: NADH-quinone oxidoreductase subunit L, partial [Anaeromyxobacteraceae bacterium]|nr:NADH-quinone oxidoreductase subunit L [Anaeromyxobacteraceae bacterium]
VVWTGTAPAFEHWLAPVVGEALAPVHFGHAEHWVEYLFQGIGVGAAFAGWLAARALYKDAKSEVPARLKARFQGAWQVVYDKYYVDELYDVAVVKPVLALGRAWSWFDAQVIDRCVELVATITKVVANVDGAIDHYVVDGAVNGVASLTSSLGRTLRGIQTGRIQTYLYGALGGALVVVLLNFLIS